MDIAQASAEPTLTASTEASVSTPASEPVSTPDPSGASGDPGAQPVTPAYTPNYKYKVHDKEYEFDEFVRGAIKDAESEKKLRELYERSRGLDEIKSKRDKLNDEYQNYRKSSDPIVTQYNNAANYYYKAMEAMEMGNAYNASAYLDRAFSSLGIPEDVLLKHVYNKLNMKDLPPQLQKQYTRNVELEHQNSLLQQQMEQASTQQQQLAVQQRQFELTQTLAKPEIQSISSAFDQSNGKPGSFFQAVWDYAGLHYQRTGEDLTAEQAAQKFIQQFGLRAPVQAPTPQQTVVAPQQVPVIPTAKGGAASPARKKISSLEDIEKEYAQLK